MNNMPRLTLIFAALLVALGVVAYVVTGMQSVTALIPAFAGLLLALAALIACKHLKHGMHAAAMVGLLGFLGSVPGWLKLPALLSGAEVARPQAAVVQSLMALICLVFTALCVKSFIDVRRARRAEEA